MMDKIALQNFVQRDIDSILGYHEDISRCEKLSHYLDSLDVCIIMMDVEKEYDVYIDESIWPMGEKFSFDQLIDLLYAEIKRQNG